MSIGGALAKKSRTLFGSSLFPRTSTRDTVQREITQEATEKSGGMFLWVHLVRTSQLDENLFRRECQATATDSIRNTI